MEMYLVVNKLTRRYAGSGSALLVWTTKAAAYEWIEQYRANKENWKVRAYHAEKKDKEEDV